MVVDDSLWGGGVYGSRAFLRRTVVGNIRMQKTWEIFEVIAGVIFSPLLLSERWLPQIAVAFVVGRPSSV
jgi:hypothetical protein